MGYFREVTIPAEIKEEICEHLGKAYHHLGKSLEGFEKICGGGMMGMMGMRDSNGSTNPGVSGMQGGMGHREGYSMGERGGYSMGERRGVPGSGSGYHRREPMYEQYFGDY